MIPTIDEIKCTGCGECVKYCGREVYVIDPESKKAKVVNPDNCMTTGHHCADLCPAKAITFISKSNTQKDKS